MARVVVVGGGYAGLAVAARVAKAGHTTTVLEAGPALGGSLLPIRQDGFSWDRIGSTLTLPAVLRDLFRKSGRPLERELTLEPITPGRRHVLDRTTTLDLPMGNRGDQVEAIDAALGTGGEVWAQYVDSLAPVWEVLRRQVLEVPFSGRGDLDRSGWGVLRPRRSLHRHLRAAVTDPRLRSMASDRHVLAGQDPRALPAFAAAVDYVERSFGRWRVEGGAASLAKALVRRMDTRSVDVRTETQVLDVEIDGASVHGVLVADGSRLSADVVVWAAPAPPAALAASGSAPTPAIPAAMTYLGLEQPVPDLPAETFVHGDPLVLIRTALEAPTGHTAWTVEHRSGAEDVLVAMVRMGIDVRHRVTVRIDHPPGHQVAGGGSRRGMRWQGWRSGFDRPTVATPVKGLYRVGPSVHPGPGLELVGLGAAQAATLIGPG